MVGRLFPFPTPIVAACHRPPIVGGRQSTAQANYRPIDRVVGSMPISASLACWRGSHCNRLLPASSASRRFNTSPQTPAASRSPAALRRSISIEACRNAPAPCSRSIASAQPQTSWSRVIACAGPSRQTPRTNDPVYFPASHRHQADTDDTGRKSLHRRGSVPAGSSSGSGLSKVDWPTSGEAMRPHIPAQQE